MGAGCSAPSATPATPGALGGPGIALAGLTAPHHGGGGAGGGGGSHGHGAPGSAAAAGGGDGASGHAGDATEFMRMLDDDDAAITLVNVNAPHLIRYASPGCERLLRFDPTELVGSSWLDHVHGSDRPAIVALIADLTAAPALPHVVTYRRLLKPTGTVAADVAGGDGEHPAPPRAAAAAPSGGRAPLEYALVNALAMVASRRGVPNHIVVREVLPTGALYASAGPAASHALRPAALTAPGTAAGSPGTAAGSAPTTAASTPTAGAARAAGGGGGAAVGSGMPIAIRMGTIGLGGGSAAAGAGASSGATAASAPAGGGGTSGSSLATGGGADRILRYAVNELFNAMHALNASATSLMDNVADMPSETRADLADIVFAAHSTQVLVSEILTLSKLKEGGMALAPEVLNLRTLAREVAGRVRPVCRSPIELRISPSVPSLLITDVSLVTQLLLNAVTLSAKHAGANEEAPIHIAIYRSGPPPPDFRQGNGVTALPLDGAVAAGAGAGSRAGAAASAVAASAPSSLSLSASGDRYLTIEILDTGAGIGGSDGEQLMQALATAGEKAVRGARAQRLALLLPIARMVVELMNGAVGVEEKRVTMPASGSGEPARVATVVRFAFTLPYTEPSDAEARRTREELGLGGADGLADESEGIITHDRLPLPVGAVTRSPEFAAATTRAPVTVTDATTRSGGSAAAPGDAGRFAAGTVSPRGGAGSGRSVGAPGSSTASSDKLVAGVGSGSGTRLPHGGGGSGAGSGITAALTSDDDVTMGAGAGSAVGGSAGGAGDRGRGGRTRGARAVVGLDGHPLNMHVLLVDDVGVIRRQGQLFLEQLGCTCVTLEDGDEVEKALASTPRPFDAIVMDIVMHRSDGATVCRTLRERYAVRCPIIAMTGNTLTRDMQRYYAMGFDVVLPKPFTREAIGRALAEGRERRGGNTRFARMEARIFDPQPGIRSVGPEPGTPALPAGSSGGSGSGMVPGGSGGGADGAVTAAGPSSSRYTHRRAGSGGDSGGVTIGGPGIAGSSGGYIHATYRGGIVASGDGGGTAAIPGAIATGR